MKIRGPRGLKLVYKMYNYTDSAYGRMTALFADPAYDRRTKFYIQRNKSFKSIPSLRGNIVQITSFGDNFLSFSSFCHISYNTDLFIQNEFIIL